MNPKTDSFKVVRSPAGNKIPSLEIVLAHGFKSLSTGGFREYLERWLKHSTKEYRDTARATAFAFETADILSKGVDELEKTSDKFLSKVRSLENSGKEARNKGRWKRKDERNSQRSKFLFVAHGFGTWVVKNALARFDSFPLSHVTLGVIFLDMVKPDGDPTSLGYSQYLKTLSQELLRESSDHEEYQKTSSELKTRLVEVHRNWHNIRTDEYAKYIKHYNVETIESNMDMSKATNTWRTSFERITGKSDPIVGEELAHAFDRFSSMPSPPVIKSGSQFAGDMTRQSDSASASQTDHLDRKESRPRFFSHSSSALVSTNKLQYSNVPSRRKSMIPLSEASEHRASIASSINDEMGVSKISTNALSLQFEEEQEFRKISTAARSYLQRGELYNAYILFRRCDTMMKHFQMENKIQHVQIRMQMAVTQLQKGEYNDAMEKLKELRDFLNSHSFEEIELKEKIGNELEWWFALSLLRQGRYKQARNELRQLAKRNEIVRSKGMTPDMSEEDHVLATAKVRRLIALASGYLGDYKDAFDQIEHVSRLIDSLDSKYLEQSSQINISAESVQEIPENSSLKSSRSVAILTLQHNFELTRGVILMLWGDYSEALDKATSAKEGLVKQWGQKHFRSLEAASLIALLLAFKSEIREAEKTCQKTQESMTKVLGNKHPLTLQNMDVQIYIFRTQARFIEAIDTSISLCKRTEASLGPSHPQTLRSKSQLAAAHFFNGNYKTSENILMGVVQTSQKTFGDEQPGDEHPETLRFKSELARAYCYSWKTDLAEELVLKVIWMQKKVFTIGKQKQNSRPQLTTKSSTKALVEDLLRDIMDDIETLRVHPDLLFSLQLLAKIESKKLTPDLDLVLKIQEAVWKTRMAKLTQVHALSLISEFELASTYREMQDLQKAEETFVRIAEKRTKLLGIDHPDTLTARHEALVMQFTLGIVEDAYDLQTVLKLREWQLGRSHPDTLQSLLWIFAIRLLYKHNNKAHETADKLLDRLRQASVRSERLVESLQMEEKVALFYAGECHFERSAKIFRVIIDTITDLGSFQDELSALKSLRTSALNNLERVESSREQVLLKLKDLTKRALSELNEGNTKQSNILLQEAYDIYKATGWGEESVLFRSELAANMWRSEDAKIKKQALAILSESLSYGEKVLGEKDFEILHSRQQEWLIALKPKE